MPPTDIINKAQSSAEVRQPPSLVVAANNHEIISIVQKPRDMTSRASEILIKAKELFARAHENAYYLV